MRIHHNVDTAAYYTCKINIRLISSHSPELPQRSSYKDWREVSGVKTPAGREVSLDDDTIRVSRLVIPSKRPSGKASKLLK